MKNLLFLLTIMLLTKTTMGNNFTCSSSDRKMVIKSVGVGTEWLAGTYSVVRIKNNTRTSNVFFFDGMISHYPKDVQENINNEYTKAKNSLLPSIAQQLKIKENDLADIKNDERRLRVLKEIDAPENNLFTSIEHFKTGITQADYEQIDTNLDVVHNFKSKVTNLSPWEVKELDTNNIVMNLTLNPNANIVKFSAVQSSKDGYMSGRIIFNALFTYPAMKIANAKVTCIYDWHGL